MVSSSCPQDCPSLPITAHVETHKACRHTSPLQNFARMGRTAQENHRWMTNFFLYYRLVREIRVPLIWNTSIFSISKHDLVSFTSLLKSVKMASWKICTPCLASYGSCSNCTVFLGVQSGIGHNFAFRTAANPFTSVGKETAFTRSIPVCQTTWSATFSW